MIPIMSQPFFYYLMELNHSKRHFGAGALVFERGDPVRWYYTIHSGEVHLLRRQEDGAEVVLQRATTGSILAEASFNSQSYHCAAVAKEPSVLQVFRRDHVRAMLEETPAAALAYGAHLAREVQNARRRAEIISLRRVGDRLDAWLVWHDGEMPQKGQWNRIAEEIGVSREALYRELARRR